MRYVFFLVLMAFFGSLVIAQDFDFVAGNDTLFSDFVSYRSGDVPTKWSIQRGTIEVQDFNGEKVIRFVSPSGHMVAKLPAGNQMPSKFTIEFEVYFEKNKSIDYEIGLWDDGKKLSPEEKLVKKIRATNKNTLYYNQTHASTPKNDTFETGWRKISISYDNGKVKAYIDNYRLLNIPEFSGKLSGITFFASHSSDYPCLMKNFSLKGFKEIPNTINTGSMGH